VLVFVDFLRRNFSLHDFAKQAVFHVPNPA
jgi:hypothetical protein